MRTPRVPPINPFMEIVLPFERPLRRREHKLCRASGTEDTRTGKSSCRSYRSQPSALDPQSPVDRQRRLVDGGRLELPTSALRTPPESASNTLSRKCLHLHKILGLPMDGT